MLPSIKRIRTIRRLLWGGGLVFAAGALLDLAAHALPGVGALPLGGVTFETAAHLLTFLGMVILLLGVLSTARRPTLTAPVANPARERRPPA